MIHDVEVVETVIELLDWYLYGNVSPEFQAIYGDLIDPEFFLQKVFEEWTCDESTMESIAELFFKVLKYEKYLSLILEDYYKKRPNRLSKDQRDKCLYLVFLYYALFELNEESLAAFQCLLLSLNEAKALALSKYMKKSNFISTLYAIAVKIWDIDYVKNNLLSSVSEANFKELHDGVSRMLIETKLAKKKKLTQPVDMQVLKHGQKPRQPPTISSEEIIETPVFKHTEIPSTTYKSSNNMKRLAKLRRKNKEKAAELYEEAQKHAFRAAKPLQKKIVVEPENSSKARIRRSKIPVAKAAEIQPKTTASVILRVGARLMKMEQDEIKRLDDIMRGAVHNESLKNLEKEMQEERMRKHMENIEKKHLQGLLTYEEALIAKRKYQKKVKENAAEFRKEKELWTKQLEEWRAEEQIRIQESVERGKSYEKSGKEAMELIKQEKHRMAMETMEESRILKERLIAEREEILRRKIQMIKEIKALQALGVIKRRETMANAAASIGLLCEMSTEELKERLMILRMEVKEEIERRREEFKHRKECRKAIVDGYKDLIEQHQEIRKEKQKLEQLERKPEPVFKTSPSVEELKKKLDEKRKERQCNFPITKNA